ncbi:MAG TPA: Fe-S cluster assembly protein SufD [Pyrinomonadaceae bacterium]|nr:Fe-S cluster assembly protein SufD [Pyrinomonadaceae bacterium]
MARWLVIKKMVSDLATPENNYQAAFRALQQTKPSAPWVELVRESAMDRFQSLGFPSVTNEEWKYTNLAPLAKDASFRPATEERLSAITKDAISSFVYPETGTSHLVLVNGFLSPELSTITGIEGAVALDLFAAVSDGKYGRLVREYLARNACYKNNGLRALNTALLQSGLFLLIPRNTNLQTPIQITYLSGSPDSTDASFPRVLVLAEENSSATIVESYVTIAGNRYFTDAVMELVLKEGARLKHYRVQRESSKAFHVASTSAELGRGSSYDATSINLGAFLARHDISVVMEDEGAECWVDGLYLVGADQHSDTHSVIDHKKPHCTSHQLYKGILDGNGRAVFNGKIFVREGAQKTDAMQTNKNLLLSSQARVDTKPQLEIFADDVKCAHGAAVGQIDEEELFYLQARGINPDLARNLLTYGFAEEVIGKITIDSIRSQLDATVLHQLHAQIEA